MNKHYEIVVVGAGMAGASLAAELATEASVLLIEMETQPGYHTTGRSAALFAPTYGPAPIRALTRASTAFYKSPPAGFSEHPLLTPRGVIMLANHQQLPALDKLIEQMSAEGEVSRLSAAQMLERVPLLRSDYVAAGMLDESSQDIDVHGLHLGYLRLFRQRGGKLAVNARVESIEPDQGRWTITGRGTPVSAAIVVNAAGAWAEQLGAMAGAAPIGLVPKRRTAMLVSAPAQFNPQHWPAVVDVQEQFYLKPDAGRLLISPADETPSEPTDAQPEEYDIALCVDRIQTAFDLPVTQIKNSWAGLRSFVADGAPVCGFDPAVAGLFWLAGQGGYGIQTAPALARTAAALLLGKPVPSDVLDQGLDVNTIGPQRLGR